MRNKGITLIALVITIIVLLILAGVSISLLVGENGMITNAMKAREETKTAQEEELRKLTMAEAAMNFEQTEYVYTDKDGEKTIPIPENFAVSQVKGENKVENGLVIIDSEGNEFVWIPVDNPEEYKTANELSKTEDWPENGYKDKETETSKWANDSTQMTTAFASVEKYKGFYVARYEAGVPSNASFYVPSNPSGNGKKYEPWQKKNVTKENEQDLKPVSKKGNQVWSLITQKNAKEVSERMYADNSTVNSYLIDSNAWNYICQYKFKDILEKEGKTLTDSSTYGNYDNNTTTNYEGIKGLFAKYSRDGSHGTWVPSEYKYGNIPSDYAPRGPESDYRLELATGICDDFKVYNIYDMAGNMAEWTDETITNSSKKYIALCGGGFNSRGYVFSVCSHFDKNDTTSADYGFRTVLYLK